jgi:hypothetical protein
VPLVFITLISNFNKIQTAHMGGKVLGHAGVKCWAGPGGCPGGEEKKKKGPAGGPCAWADVATCTCTRTSRGSDGQTPSSSPSERTGKESRGGWRLPVADGGRRRSSGGRWRVEGVPGRGRKRLPRPPRLLPWASSSQQLPARRWRRWPPVVLGGAEVLVRARKERGEMGEMEETARERRGRRGVRARARHPCGDHRGGGSPPAARGQGGAAALRAWREGVVRGVGWGVRRRERLGGFYRWEGGAGGVHGQWVSREDVRGDVGEWGRVTLLRGRQQGAGKGEGSSGRLPESLLLLLC